MKRLALFDLQISVVLILSLKLAGCAQTNSESVDKTETRTCVNGVCTTTSSETRTSKTSGVNSTGVSAGSSANVGVNTSPVPIGAGGVPGPVVITGGVVTISGGLTLNSCVAWMAPVGACSAVGEVEVITPKHLGCTASGNHAWSCQDSFSGAPPYAVVSCSGAFSDSCAKIGQVY